MIVTIAAVVFGITYYSKYMLKSETYNEEMLMYTQRLRTAISDAFQTRLRRQPTSSEMESILSDMVKQLNGATLGKGDLNAMVIGLIVSKKIK
jgi:hypothetical protein